MNSNISSFNSCWFPRSGVGVNFKPFSNIFVEVSLFVVSAVKFLALFDRPALKNGSGPGLIIYYKIVHPFVCFCSDLTYTCKRSAGRVSLLLVMGWL